MHSPSDHRQPLRPGMVEWRSNSTASRLGTRQQEHHGRAAEASDPADRGVTSERRVVPQPVRQPLTTIRLSPGPEIAVSKGSSFGRFSSARGLPVLQAAFDAAASRASRSWENMDLESCTRWPPNCMPRLQISALSKRTHGLVVSSPTICHTPQR
jgi:hypothetical protein